MRNASISLRSISCFHTSAESLENARATAKLLDWAGLIFIDPHTSYNVIVISPQASYNISIYIYMIYIYIYIYTYCKTSVHNRKLPYRKTAIPENSPTIASTLVLKLQPELYNQYG